MFAGQMMVPLVIRTVSGGGRQLAATHSQTPDVIFAHFPGLKVVAPGTPEDAKGLLKSAIRSDDPVLFIESATLYQLRGEVTEAENLIPIGKSKIQRPGTDVTISWHKRGSRRKWLTSAHYDRWIWGPFWSLSKRPTGR
jgi:pyruvate dehydrogenase E1 component beta subunit